MAKISLDNITAGMVLASDAKERSGRVLLRAGTELTERHLNIFKTWGVTEADIESVTPDEAAVNAAAEATSQIDPQVLEKAEKYVDALFALSDKTQPPIRELMRICTLRKARLFAREMIS